ncbi:MAG TPA: VWA domain-containing protein [Spirochaetia bacterium]|nr:VWA domain-containing protein [Spirochaetia bacterium]
MKIASPGALWFLLLLFPIVLILIRSYGFGRHDLRVLGGRWQREELGNVYLVKSFFSGLFFCLFFTFAVLSLAGISWGQTPAEDDRAGLDIVIAIDVSRSMLAEDVKPSRLDRSRDIIRGLLRELPGTRYGIAVFKGSGAAVIPITEDRLSIESLMDYLSPAMLTAPGTNIESGIDTALSMFPSATGRFRAMILFSDGEAQDGNPYAAADRATKDGIPIFTVVAGTTQGSTVPLPDGQVVRDGSGRPIESRANIGVLDDISQVTGGVSVQLTDPGVFSELLSALQRHAGSRSTGGFTLADVPRYRIFLGLALMFLVFSLGIRVVKWKNTF